MKEMIYRPPFEAESFLLQVTHGCSHNKCCFCTMYKGVEFSLVSEEDVDAQLRYGKRYDPERARVFLENGDPFAMSAERLIAVCEKIHAYLPKVETIAMYASINNIRNKSDEELRQLRELGVNELNIGVESGLNDTLDYLNKGYTSDEALHQLLRLKEAGIEFGANVIFGAAGKGRHKENAVATAQLLNKTQPYLIFTGTMHADSGCVLYEDIQSGRFAEPTFGEYLEEEKVFIENLEVDGCRYFALHPSNVTRMQGFLPQDKDLLLGRNRWNRKALEKMLDRVPIRMGEGAIIG